MDASIRPIETDEQVAAAWPVVHQLRPHLDRDALIAAVRRQRSEGYLAAGAYAGEVCVAFAGYRIQQMLAHGRLLYVDDLVSDASARGAGYGRSLMAWLRDAARRAGCATLQLDSGSHRLEAHAFYFRFGLRITSYHFAMRLDTPA
ncbi:GNAT family N-acetyltransferase [Pseudomarimonas salicorniae]|uniref:GNAT family N-acetyltransferase n=1 Tax=Pseudomarimonas salicorniae TaxID=2933270 RepID=A0ABT0GC92_9GAMM|nr:GNAT family N-acetyltransferase [Lysobacter sp. CAU 1642]MCK7592151.1 GNAT family N-acetyltransferase [Lysobacter sp. CAU 1642]